MHTTSTTNIIAAAPPPIIPTKAKQATPFMPYPILRIPFGIPSIAFLAASPHHASQAHIKPKKGKEKEGKRKKKKKKGANAVGPTLGK